VETWVGRESGAASGVASGVVGRARLVERGWSTIYDALMEGR
jgi:hypothetical protein